MSLGSINDPKGEAGSKKCPLALVPPVAMEQTAWVHKLGAEKYGKKIPVFACSNGEELEEFCSCGYSILSHSAIQNDHTLQKDSVLSATRRSIREADVPIVTTGGLRGQKVYANPATTKNLEQKIQTTENASLKQRTAGCPLTRSTSENKQQFGIGDQKQNAKTLFQPELEPSHHLASPSMMRSESCSNKTTDAQYAEDQQGEKGCSTSTTTTKQESLEELSAIDATKDLASSEMILSLLKKHSPICDVRNLIVREGSVEQYGSFNWRRSGVCASTYISAIMRHLNAWRDGEDLDPESGISHIAHVACSCNILLDAQNCGTLQDDRNKKPQNQ